MFLEQFIIYIVIAALKTLDFSVILPLFISLIMNQTRKFSLQKKDISPELGVMKGLRSE